MNVLDKFPIIRSIVDGEDDEVKRGQLLAVLAGPSPASEELSYMLTELGCPVSAPTIRAYRRAVARQNGRDDERSDGQAASQDDRPSGRPGSSGGAADERTGGVR